MVAVAQGANTVPRQVTLEDRPLDDTPLAVAEFAATGHAIMLVTSDGTAKDDSIERFQYGYDADANVLFR